jgi:hypothetical protein
MTTERRWFSVIVVFESRVAGIIGVRPLCEERIVLFVAEDEPTAIAAARRYGVSAQHSYDNSARETVQWIFVGVSDANELEERMQRSVGRSEVVLFGNIGGLSTVCRSRRDLRKLAAWRSTGCVMLDYDDIGEIIYPHREDYEISDHLRIRTLSGTAIDLPICGGRGRFRDVWPFIRFIRRVLWEPESPGASG